MKGALFLIEQSFLYCLDFYRYIKTRDKQRKYEKVRDNL